MVNATVTTMANQLGFTPGIIRSLPLRSRIYTGPPPVKAQYMILLENMTSNSISKSFMFKYMKFPRLFRWMLKYLLYIYRNIKQYI